MMIQESGRSSQLYTIISRETIKPSSPTPPHLRTYNLSPNDQNVSKTYVSFIFFYPKNDNCTLTPDDKSRVLKESLSKSLTRYYPFAGRMTGPTSSFVDCNDEGVVFLEARTNTQLDTFLNLSEQTDESLYPLIANDLACYDSPRNESLVGVQLNHFACGGIGLAVSISHIISDGSTLGSFLCHWASLARYGSIDHEQVKPFNPIFIHYTPTDSKSTSTHHQRQAPDRTNVVSRKFVFPNSKLSNLKKKVAFEGGLSINNLSRVEVLTSLLYKTALSSVSCGFNPSCLFMMVNVRDKFVQKLPQTTFGNIYSLMMIPTMHESESSLSMVVSEIKKHKLQLEGIESTHHVVEHTNSMRSKLRTQKLEATTDGLHWCSSLCGFPFNKVDFGWGKPMGTFPVARFLGKNGFMLIDTPDGNGIEAWVVLEKERMKMFANNKELLDHVL